jgi:L,D-transpeptidase YcbB
MKTISIIFSVFLLLSCQEESKKLVSLEKLPISIREKIERSIDPLYLSQLGIDESTLSFLDTFYKKNHYQPKWINDSTLTAQGIQLKKLLTNKIQFGIPDTRYRSFQWKKTSLLQDEIMITTTLAFLAKDLQVGFLHADTMLVRNLSLISVQELEQISMFASDSLSLKEQILGLGPVDTNYRQLAIGLLDYCSRYPIDTSSYEIESIKLDSLGAEPKARISLYSKGYLQREDADSIVYNSALKLFQKHNGLHADGVIGKFTAQALSESTQHKLLRTALSMEKWRWKTNYPKKFVRINIPEYALRLFMDDTLQRLNRIIVGKSITPTPELSGTIHQIVVYPYWTVPQSICDKEILPKVKQNVNYLVKNGYRIFRKEEEVDPTTVNWSKFKEHLPFKVRQDYGPKNSLGIIKFEFHNRYGVYVHDTPQRGLFGADVRSFSHGCMRCQNPVDLAKTILEKDSTRRGRNEITPLLLDSLLEVGEHHRITLKDPLPLFVEYKTVTVYGPYLVFHLDIYGRDEKYLQLFLSEKV